MSCHWETFRCGIVVVGVISVISIIVGLVVVNVVVLRIVCGTKSIPASSSFSISYSFSATSGRRGITISEEMLRWLLGLRGL